MKRFAALYAALDSTTKTTEKVAALVRYFQEAPAEDAAWALYFLTGNTVPRPASTATLRAWVAEAAELPLWLVEESYHIVGDLAETFALLLPPNPEGNSLGLKALVETSLLPLPGLPEEVRRTALKAMWQTLSQPELFLFMKLITGGLRVGVQRTLLSRALGVVANVPQHQLAHRLMGGVKPTAEYLQQLLDSSDESNDHLQPYPLCLAYALDEPLESLGPREDWQIEWKWDGIRAEVLKRNGEVLIWSRGEEVVTDTFPEVASACARLPGGTVLDGEIVAWNDGMPLPFGELQRRLNRKSVGKKMLQDVPVHLIAYDLLELEGKDRREWPTAERREALEGVVSELASPVVSLSPILPAASWDEIAELRQQSRTVEAEGLMIKRLSAPYGVGRRRGLWWKWKIEPRTCDAVLVYAQRGHGRRAGLYTDYTFAVWKDGTLVPVAKAYSGLTDKEFLEVNRFIRDHTIERFGPVVTVEPQLVFEIAFEGIRVSSRHKAGLALRFPRIARPRPDKTVQDADTVDTLLALVAGPT